MTRALFLTLALAAGSAAAGPDGDPEDMDIEGIAGKRLPELELAPTGSEPTDIAEWKKYVENLPYPLIAHRGAEVLGLEPEYVHRTREGFAMVFRREYKGARQHFVKLDQDFPGTGISGSVDTLVWQALMLENFDFRYDRQYKLANEKAQKDLKVALAAPGHQAWEHFQLAGLMGVEAIHMVRQGSYLPALNLAFEAMDHIQESREAAPAFTDLAIADGMYNYWRTVVTMSSRMLPDFGDNRALGISQMREVERSGYFLQAPADMALAFAYLEERKYKTAMNSCADGRRDYPDNVINNLLTAQTFIHLKHYDDALGVLAEIEEDAPDNNRVHYYRGLAYLRKGDQQAALRSLERYLASDHLEDWQRASGHYRLGQAHYRLKSYASAEYQYKLAVKVDNFKPAKHALERMKAQKKEGRISY